MNGTDYLIDTNILVYILQGNKTVRFFAQENMLSVSSITEMEILGKFEIKDTEKQVVSRLLSRCNVIDISHRIKQITIYLRQKYRVKLPDAIVAATAIEQNLFGNSR